MPFTADLLGGLAALLADAGIAEWHPDGSPYAGAGPVITLGGLPDQPDRAIALAAYPLADNPATNDSKVGVQFRCRGDGDSRTADGLADQVFDLLHGATHLRLDGVHVVQALRQSSAPLDLDATGRWNRADSYHLDCARPTANRP